jgi:outer membrane protein assembly factor BamB
MRHRTAVRIALVALVLIAAPGCSTVKGWFGGGKVKPDEPTKLQKLAQPIAVRKLWSMSLGDGEGRLWLRSHPVVDGARLYAITDEGEVVAVDAASGKKIWTAQGVEMKGKRNKIKFWSRKDLEAGLSGGPGAGSGLVVVGGRNGEVVALDAETGKQRWLAKVSSEVLSAPLVLADRVVVRSNDGRVFGLDPADGARKWVFDRGLPTLSVRGNSSPVAGNGLAYIGYDDGTVVALRAEDGLRVWEQAVADPDGRTELDRMADIDGELQLGLNDVYATSFHDRTMAMNAVNGQPIWAHDVGGSSGVALLDDKVLLSDKSGNVWALDRASGNPVWKQDALLRRQLTSPVIQGEYAVVGDLDGYLHWLRLDTGVIAGRTRIERAALRGTPQVSTDGVLYAVTNEGKLVAYKLGN